MTKKKPDAPENFDARLARLQEIVDALESGEPPLEKGLALYKEGMALAALCRAQLEKARNEVLLCAESGLTPFDAERATEEKDD